MTDFYNGKPLEVKRMETPDGVQKDKAVNFDKETGKFLLRHPAGAGTGIERCSMNRTKWS